MPKNGEGDSLFAAASEAAAGEPLAARMRPRSLDEFIGQEEIVGPGRLLRRAIQKDQLSSLIFSGPPGTGKTTLARVIANTTSSRFVTLNAVLAGIADIRTAVEEAKRHRELYGRRTILFVDEVHRWNKAQQDALLPWVENGTIVLIGATTENPFFEVNRALVSRSRVFQLRSLVEADLLGVAKAALGDTERGYGRWRVSFEEGGLEHLVKVADGDARSLLNALELAVETSAASWPPPDGAEIRVDLKAAEESIQRRAVLYDKDGDWHYDCASAFIKSLRGSDPDAALYWLARMVYSGEDPRFVFRRMLISACEDVGQADPQALSVVLSCADAFDRIGMPEGQYHLAQACLYLATAPKSNSALGYFDAYKSVAAEQAEVPGHLKDSSRDKEGFGHGEGYLYPHAYRDHWVAQEYLPSSLRGRIFYQPGSLGLEGERRAGVLERREAQVAAIWEEGEGSDALRDTDRAREDSRGLVWSEAGSARSAWKVRAEGGAPERLSFQRKNLFEIARPLRHDRVLVLDAREGYFVWEALRRSPEGTVVALVRGSRERELLEQYASTLQEIERPLVLEGGVEDLDAGRVEEAFGFRGFDLVLGRDLLQPAGAAPERLARLAAAFPGARYSGVESLTREGGRLSAALSCAGPGGAASTAGAAASGGAAPGGRTGGYVLEGGLAARFEAFEEGFYAPSNALLGRDGGAIEAAYREAAALSGNALCDLAFARRSSETRRRFTREELAAFFSPASPYGQAARAAFSDAELDLVSRAVVDRAASGPLPWPAAALYVSARFQSPSAGLDT